MYYRFTNHAEAGQALVKRLSHLANEPDLNILALPRGGAPIGYEIAKALHTPLQKKLIDVHQKYLKIINPTGLHQIVNHS